MIKQTDLFQESFFINSDSYYSLDILTEIREEFNEAFKREKIDITVESDFTISRSIIANMPPLNKPAKFFHDLLPNLHLNDFFFFPSHKLYFFNGIEKKEIGIRICFLRNGKSGLKCRVFDITNKQYQGNGKWIKEGSFGKKLKFMESFQEKYPDYMTIFNEIAKNRFSSPRYPHVVYTNQTGWVEGGRNWFYVPVSTKDEYDLIYNDSIRTKYLMTPSSKSTMEEVFKQMMSMLDVADKRVTLPLLSYAFLSLVTSLMNFKEDEFPKFMINISGGNKALNSRGFANLFCNFYERKLNISSLSSKFHLNSDMDRILLEKKSAKIRDGIFILNAESRPKIVKKAQALLQNVGLENMMLLLNEKKLDLQYVINLNINNLEVNSSRVDDLRKNSKDYSECIYWVTEHFKRIFDLDDTSDKKKVGKYIHKKYEHFRKLIECNNLPQEEDKLHMYACLLIGFDLLLSIKKNDSLIFNDTIQNDEVQAYMDEAIQLFQIECVIEGEVFESVSNDDDSKDIVKEEHIAFLEKLFEILPDQLPNYKQKSDTMDSWAWTDTKVDNVLIINLHSR